MVRYSFLEAVHLALKYPDLSLRCCTNTDIRVDQHIIFGEQDYVKKRLQWKETKSPVFIDEKDINNLEFELDVDFNSGMNGLEVEIVTEFLKGLKGYLYVSTDEIKVCVNLDEDHGIGYRCTVDDFKLLI